MNLLLNSQFTIHNSQLKLTGSKSETNRLLLLQALYPNLTLENASNSDDSEVMAIALNSQLTIDNSQLIDVHHAGTAMRFLTAYFAIQEGKDLSAEVEVVITGSSRKKDLLKF
jgi:3-phosphoshikimate 1-carboxyvinyltransferase